MTVYGFDWDNLIILLLNKLVLLLLRIENSCVMKVLSSYFAN